MIRFYCFYSISTIVISDHSIDKIKRRYPYSFEILTSIKDRNSIDIVRGKLTKTYRDFEWSTWLKHIVVHTAESNLSRSRTMTGRKRPDVVKERISRNMKGRIANFTGHRHNGITKMKMAEKKWGNTAVKGRIWVNDGKGNEKRVYPDEVPVGWKIGRDYDIRELISYNLKR